MLLYRDNRFLDHDTGAHPEKAERLLRVHQALDKVQSDAPWRAVPVRPVELERIARVHSLDYARELESFAKDHGGYIESDTVVSSASYQVALLAAGAVCDAVTQVVNSDEKRAFCLVRPPGHHALQGGAMGFCLFNSIAVGARVATAELDIERVLIVDFDVHHGNGTQDCFWEDEQVSFLSIHRFPFYPGSGSAEETGRGAGLGTIRNLPVEFGTSRDEYHKTLERGVQQLAARCRPQLLLLSAGFDSHRLDPIGSLGLDVEDFERITRLMVGVANEYADGRIVSVLEGGYNVDVLPDCVIAHLKELGG